MTALSALTDEDLMGRVQDGDRAAYRELFERYQVRIYSFLLRKLQNRSLADELFQETFLAVYRARATWERGRIFRPWLFAIATNLARDHARRERRRPEPADTDVFPPTQPQSNTRIHLEAAIAGLPDTLRDAFLLGVVEGLSHNEIASLLDISAVNARARISRARAWLRERLGGPEAP